MTPLIREMIGMLPKYSEENDDLVWFDAATIPRYLPVQPQGVLATTPLPFDHCALVCVSGDGHKMLFLIGQKEMAVVMSGWILRPNDFVNFPEVQYARIDGEIKVASEHKGKDRDASMLMLGALQHFLACANQEGYRGTPKRNSLINAKRAKKGKPPLQYDWRTVTIEPPKPKDEPLGGTHASPRQHDRRGHWRTYPSGKKGWVKSCKVGDAAAGAVFKDYRVKQEAVCQPADRAT